MLRNPSVPEDIIIMIYNTDKKNLLRDCAMNPNCPKEIIDDILNSDNEIAKKWLKIFGKRVADQKENIGTKKDEAIDEKIK